MLRVPYQEFLEKVELGKVAEQRILSAYIFDKIVPARTIPVRLGTKEAIDPLWSVGKDSVAIRSEMDGFPAHHTNYGFTYSAGLLDVDIDSDDPSYNHCIRLGLELVGVRVTLSWGRESVTYGGNQVASHILLRHNGNLADHKRQILRPFFRNAKKHHTELRGASFNSKKNVVDSTRHTIVPGSLVMSHDERQMDLIMWIDHNAVTTPPVHDIPLIIAGVAVGQVLHVMRDHWNESGRHDLALRFSGFLIAIVDESIRINTEPTHPLHGNVVAWMDSDQKAESIIQALCRLANDPEEKDRLTTYRNARTKQLRGANMPGRTALKEHTKSPEDVTLIESWLISGTSLSSVHDLQANLIMVVVGGREVYYILQDRFRKGGQWFYHREAVQNIYKGVTVQVGRSMKPAFDIFEMAERTEADGYGLFPNNASGELLRFRKNGELIPDGYEGDINETALIFNTWRGFAVKPIRHADDAEGRRVINCFDELVRLVTRGDEGQSRYVKAFFADIVQNPGIKPPAGIISMGGKGWGKSTLFVELPRRLLGAELTGVFTNSILSGKFTADIAKDKLLLVGNELTRLDRDSDKTLLGNLIKDTFIAGEGKFIRASNFHNLARVVVTTNSMEFNITARDAPRGEPERALFYIRCFDALSLNMSHDEYASYRLSFRPFFEEVYALLSNTEAMSHLMWHLSKFEYDRRELADLSASAFNDPEVLLNNLDYPTTALHRLLSENNVGGGEDTKFSDAVRWGSLMTVLSVRAALDHYAKVDTRYAVNAALVVERMLDFGIAERRGPFFIPTMKYGSALERFKERTRVPVPPGYELGPDDFGAIDPNTVYIPPGKTKR
jgi:hypothetical protein